MRRKQTYQYHINRKRLHKKTTRLPDISVDLIKKNWEVKKSAADNLAAMGLVADPNKMRGIKIPSRKEKLKMLKEPAGIDGASATEPGQSGSKGHVVSELEKEAKEGFKAAKATPHPLPKGMVKKLTDFLDKFGEDFDAMSRDYTNYDQETPAQLRTQVNRLKSVPQQWIPYLKSRGLLTNHDVEGLESSITVSPKASDS